MAKVSWGLDISKSSLKAVKLEWVQEELTVTRLEVLPYTPSATRDEAVLEQEIRNALSTFIGKYKLKGEHIAASLPGHSTFNRFIKVPPVDLEAMNNVISPLAQQHIPFDINEVIWTYQLIDQPYSPGEDVDVVLFAAKKQDVDQFMSILDAGGLSIDNVQFAPVALYNFISYDQEIDRDTVVLDMGAQNTDLILIEGEKFWIRNLPVVGNDLTKAIQQKFDIPFAEAEQLKRATRGSQQAGKVFNTIQTVLKELVSEVHRSIGYYKSLSKSGQPVNFGRMVIAGNASKIIYFKEFISQRLQLEPVHITQLNNIKTSEEIDKKLLRGQLPSLGVAFGLALQGLELTKNQINLLPQEVIRKKALARKKPWFAAIAAFVILFLGLLHFSAQGQYTQLNDKYNDIEALSKKCNKIARRYDEVKDTQAIQDFLNTITDIIPNQSTWLRILHAFKQIRGLNIEGLDNKKGYIEEIKKQSKWVLNVDDEDALKRFENNKIWVLSLKATQEYPKAKEGEEKTQLDRPYISLSLICGIVYRRDENGSPDPIKSQEFVKSNLVKPLTQHLNIPVIDPVPYDVNPVMDLRSPDDPKVVEKGYEPKYYRYRVNLKIPLE